MAVIATQIAEDLARAATTVNGREWLTTLADWIRPDDESASAAAMLSFLENMGEQDVELSWPEQEAVIAAWYALLKIAS